MSDEIEDGGYVLHDRALSDSKRIYVLFTSQHGLVSVVFRQRKQKTLKPFQYFELAWFGKSELKTLKYSEADGALVTLLGKNLFCGMYLNELLARALSYGQSHAALFDAYQNSLGALALANNEIPVLEVILRRFEFLLLGELGFAIPFFETFDGEKIEPDEHFYYSFGYDSGFRRLLSTDTSGYAFSGRDIFNIANEHWNGASLRAAKRLSRLALTPILGAKPLKSRELFQ